MKYKVNGLASARDYQKYDGDCPYSQVILEAEYTLLQDSPDIRSVNQITAKPIILETCLITNSPRPKILITGQFKTFFEYTASGSLEAVHSWSGEQYFQMYLQIPKFDPDLQVKDLILLLENIEFQRIHGRKFKVFLLVFAYAIL